MVPGAMSSNFSSEPTKENVTGDRVLDSSVAVLEPQEVVGKSAESTGPCCSNCGASQKAASVTICPSCGWYASLGRCGEVDPDFIAAEAEQSDVGDAAPAPEL